MTRLKDLCKREVVEIRTRIKAREKKSKKEWYLPVQGDKGAWGR